MIPVGTPIVSERTRRLCLRAGVLGAVASGVAV